MKYLIIVVVLVSPLLAGCDTVTPIDRARSELLTIKIRKDKEKRWRSEIKQGLNYVTDFRKQHDRLPTLVEFDKWEDSRDDLRMLALVIDPKIIETKGGKAGKDFAVGTWISDWYYYYQSWDGKYTHSLETEN